jgi:transcriptional regulator with XRE-family HTH domain
MADARKERAAVARIERREGIEASAVGRRITRARLEAGLHQREVAERIGVITRAYQNYEAGVRIPWRKLDQIAAALGTSKEWLLHGDDDGTPAADLRARLDEIVRLLHQVLERLPPPAAGA